MNYTTVRIHFSSDVKSPSWMLKLPLDILLGLPSDGQAPHLISEGGSREEL